MYQARFHSPTFTQLCNTRTAKPMLQGWLSQRTSLSGRLPPRTPSPFSPGVPRSAYPRKGNKESRSSLSQRGQADAWSSTGHKFQTCRFPNPYSSARLVLTGTLLTPCPLEAIRRISLKSMLAEAETLGQAFGKKRNYALPKRPATAKWTAWPTPLPPLLNTTTSGAFQCRLPAPFPLAAYILSGPALHSRVSGVTSAFRLQTRRTWYVAAGVSAEGRDKALHRPRRRGLVKWGAWLRERAASLEAGARDLIISVFLVSSE